MERLAVRLRAAQRCLRSMSRLHGCQPLIDERDVVCECVRALRRVGVLAHVFGANLDAHPVRDGVARARNQRHGRRRRRRRWQQRRERVAQARRVLRAVAATMLRVRQQSSSRRPARLSYSLARSPRVLQKHGQDSAPAHRPALLRHGCVQLAARGGHGVRGARCSQCVAQFCAGGVILPRRKDKAHAHHTVSEGSARPHDGECGRPPVPQLRTPRA
jgi:hypothetical protein